MWLLASVARNSEAVYLQVIHDKLVKTVLAGYLVWPAAHVVNFRFVPSDLRVLYINSVQVQAQTRESDFN